MRQTEKQKLKIIALAIVGFVGYMWVLGYQMTEDYKVKQEADYGMGSNRQSSY